MTNKIDTIVNKFVTEVSNLIGNRLKKVILYGSYARGDYNANSDLDIMILTDFTEEELVEYRMKIRDIACDIELENDIVISPVVRNLEKYNERINVIPFYTNVQKEGVVIRGWRDYSKWICQISIRKSKTRLQIVTARELIELVENYLKEKSTPNQ